MATRDRQPTEPPGFRSRWREAFRKFATWTADMAGSAWAFMFAVLIMALWGLSYPLFMRFQDGFNSWQMVINTVTNVATFLMVFLIQNMQNRDAKAIHLKLDELIRALHTARNEMVSLEKLPDEEMHRLAEEFDRIRDRAQKPAGSKLPVTPPEADPSPAPPPAP